MFWLLINFLPTCKLFLRKNIIFCSLNSSAHRIRLSKPIQRAFCIHLLFPIWQQQVYAIICPRNYLPVLFRKPTSVPVPFHAWNGKWMMLTWEFWFGLAFLAFCIISIFQSLTISNVTLHSLFTVTTGSKKWVSTLNFHSTCEFELFRFYSNCEYLLIFLFVR